MIDATYSYVAIVSLSKLSMNEAGSRLAISTRQDIAMLLYNFPRLAMPINFVCMSDQLIVPESERPSELFNELFYGDYSKSQMIKTKR